MGKCPYCSKELHLADFFESIMRVSKEGNLHVRSDDFKGEQTLSSPFIKMWVCPSCNTILGFTESDRA
ncbi:MAG: hypothetical protein ACFFDF_19200 [Candidatus Odinarchaeota archaeon]